MTADLASLPWRTGRSLGRTVYARTGGDDWEADTVIGMLDTRDLAEAACAGRNALLDLAWLAKAGFDVTVSFRTPRWRVELPGTAYGALVMCGQGETAGEALARARQWAEGRQRP
jgi:hypothetical protein